MVMANLALGAYQQRLADQFGIEPGAEQRAAVNYARENHRPVLLIDREIGVTLKRVIHNIPWWQRIGIFAGLIASILSREEVSEEEIEALKEGDMLETTFAEFAEDRQDLYLPLIDERDRYMAARIRQELAQDGHKNVLVVIGAGHLKGIRQYLEANPGNSEEVISELDHLPTPRRWPKLIPWFIVGPGLAARPGLGADQRRPFRARGAAGGGPPAHRRHRIPGRPDHLPKPHHRCRHGDGGRGDLPQKAARGGFQHPAPRHHPAERLVAKPGLQDVARIPLQHPGIRHRHLSGGV